MMRICRSSLADCRYSVQALFETAWRVASVRGCICSAPDDPVTTSYLIVARRVALNWHLVDGTRLPLHVVGPGELLAQEEAMEASLPKSPMLDPLTQHPQQATKG